MNWHLLPLEKVYNTKMNTTYLKVCYYNLYEKYECGIIAQKNWELIAKCFGF